MEDSCTRHKQVGIHVKNLNISLITSKKDSAVNRVLVRDVNFHVRPGQLVAIMGSSGSGKVIISCEKTSNSPVIP